MSRISKNPISIPDGVEYKQVDSIVSIKGKLGELHQKITSDINITFKNSIVNVKAANDSKHAHAMSGTMRSLLFNMVCGVSKGYEKKLKLVGVGYRAQLESSTLILNLGYSHLINYAIPEGIKIELSSPTEVMIKGIDKQKVGQVAAEIRSYRSPEPYKGKGVRYADEVIILKEVKKK